MKKRKINNEIRESAKEELLRMIEVTKETIEISKIVEKICLKGKGKEEEIKKKELNEKLKNVKYELLKAVKQYLEEYKGTKESIRKELKEIGIEI